MAGPDLLTTEIRVISVGLESFALELAERGIPVVHVAWAPPAGGDPRLAAMLADLADDGPSATSG
jgi:FdrA protein